jgi:hypothetical protein
LTNKLAGSNKREEINKNNILFFCTFVIGENKLGGDGLFHQLVKLAFKDRSQGGIEGGRPAQQGQFYRTQPAYKNHFNNAKITKTNKFQ